MDSKPNSVAWLSVGSGLALAYLLLLPGAHGSARYTSPTAINDTLAMAPGGLARFLVIPG